MIIDHEKLPTNVNGHCRDHHDHDPPMDASNPKEKSKKKNQNPK